MHIGFAVDTDDGLVVPVIQSAGVLGLFEIARQSSVLVEKARTGKLGCGNARGRFRWTITNLGNFDGSMRLLPSSICPRPRFSGLVGIRRDGGRDGQSDRGPKTRSRSAGLTFDHRIVDGAPAARFLQSVSQAVENPSAWLLRADA